MEDETEKKFKKIDEEIEKTNRTLYICVGIGFAGLVVLAAAPSIPVSVLIGAAGAAAGQGVHHTRKWMKNRKKELLK